MKFSVITVCLNSAETIERTITSVLEQDYNDIEYIIIDGGSIDGTVDIIRKYENEIAFWVSEPDKGIYDAMNKGIQHATGDVISFLNSSDWYEMGVLKRMEEEFRASCSDILSGRCVLVREGEFVSCSPIFPQELIYEKMIYPHQSMFARRNIFEKNGGFDLQYKICADYDWLLKSFFNGAQISTVDMVVTYFTYGGASSGILCAIEHKMVALKYLPEELYEEHYDNIIHGYNNGRNLYHLVQIPELIKQSIIKKDEIKKVLKYKLGIYESCALFGAGNRAFDYYVFLRALDIKISNVYDNSKSKQGMALFGVTIKEPKMIDKKEMILIASSEYEVEISEQLQEMNIDKYIMWEDLTRVVSGYVGGLGVSLYL